MGADSEEVVVAPTRAGELFVLLLVLRDDAAVLIHNDVTTDSLTTVVLVRDVGVEADQAGKAAAAPIGLVHDFFVVDALEQLPGKRYALGLTTDGGLVQKRIRDELKTLLDQLVVNLPLAFDLVRGLELSGKSRLQLAKPHVVKARGIHMISGDPPLGALAELDGAVNGPV